jgi:hypothetical protein
MGYKIIYKDPKRNWFQSSLEDYKAVDVIVFNRFLDKVEEFKWLQKKQFYYYLKAKGIKPKFVLRRGRNKTRYPTKTTYTMDDPRDVAEVKRFLWFTPCWNQERQSAAPADDPYQLRLDYIVKGLFYRDTTKLAPDIENLNLYVPNFRCPRYVQKNEYCEKMSDWAWEASKLKSKSPEFVSHVYYLNSFEDFDNSDLMERIKWSKKDGCLPSDVIKFEILRLLEGFSTYSDFFRMLEMIPRIQDHCAINMTHKMPTEHHFTEKLRKIGSEPVRSFFSQLVGEARNLGLIRDKIHIWDGQFHETWLQKDKSRKKGLDQFYGGTYNHGGKNIGIGVYQSTIMDWNGYCTIPVYTNIVPANINENPALRETVINAYKGNTPKPKMFIADRGPSGTDTQEQIFIYGINPIIPLTTNTTTGIRITSHKQHRFFKRYTGQTPDEILNKIYDIRTRIEEHFSLNEKVYKLSQIRGAGEEMTKIEILLINCIGVLIPLTAYKLGRPDLMWSPSAFRSITIEPSKIFPEQYRELNKMQWDDSIISNRY